MDTEELLYSIKKKLDEVAIEHEYENTEAIIKWSNEDLLELINFMRDDYYRLHHEATNKVLLNFLKYKQEKK